IQVSHPGIQQTDFVWLAVGDPGRVAVVFYGTTDSQRDASVPAYGGANAQWHAYGSISPNAPDPAPSVTAAHATDNVQHHGPCSQWNPLPDPAPANVAINSASLSGPTPSVSGTHGLPPGNWTPDPAGDARFPVWLPNGQARPNHPALDLLEASAGDNGTNLTF